MKKLILSLFVAFLFIVNANVTAQEIANKEMPSDEEIMATIKKFNFDKSQEEYLFKETKKKLEEIYNAQNPSLNLNEETTNITPKEEQTEINSIDVQDNMNIEQTNKREKKYSKHAPLKPQRTKGNRR